MSCSENIRKTGNKLRFYFHNSSKHQIEEHAKANSSETRKSLSSSHLDHPLFYFLPTDYPYFFYKFNLFT